MGNTKLAATYEHLTRGGCGGRYAGWRRRARETQLPLSHTMGMQNDPKGGHPRTATNYTRKGHPRHAFGFVGAQSPRTPREMGVRRQCKRLFSFLWLASTNEHRTACSGV
jgi:hypothetical protein